jgi:predicted DNA-binding transcriptional regulator AlpA
MSPQRKQVMSESPFIDAAGIAEYSGRSIDTIRYWERLGQLPPSAKIGRRRVWKRAQIEQHFGSMFAA